MSEYSDDHSDLILELRAKLAAAEKALRMVRPLIYPYPDRAERVIDAALSGSFIEDAAEPPKEASKELK